MVQEWWAKWQTLESHRTPSSPPSEGELLYEAEKHASGPGLTKEVFLKKCGLDIQLFALENAGRILVTTRTAVLEVFARE